MENITDALKMGAAALIFIIAFSVTMVMFSQARQTTDKIVGRLNSRDYLPKVESLGEANLTRIVGIETVIPTIYRYFQSDDDIQIRIVKDNELLQVFDANIESLAPFSLENATAENKAYYDKLADQFDDSNKEAYLFGAPWKNQNTIYYLDRINSYIYGKKSKYFDEVDYSSKEYLMKYADSTKYEFEESYLEYRTDGEVSIDEYGEEIVTRPASTKVIITYTIKEK